VTGKVGKNARKSDEGKSRRNSDQPIMKERVTEFLTPIKFDVNISFITIII
jgi:hypothetical protein